jgi:zinc protease
MATEGPSAADLENAKRYLVGSYALRFDTSAKIAAQLLGILEDELGIDYVDKRNALVEAVTLEDVRRVASRLLQPENLIVTIVGRPEGMEERG